jgi:hypothetical protein
MRLVSCYPKSTAHQEFRMSEVSLVCFVLSFVTYAEESSEVVISSLFLVPHLLFQARHDRT